VEACREAAVAVSEEEVVAGVNQFASSRAGLPPLVNTLMTEWLRGTSLKPSVLPLEFAELIITVEPRVSFHGVPQAKSQPPKPWDFADSVKWRSPDGSPAARHGSRLQTLSLVNTFLHCFAQTSWSVGHASCPSH
jgi:hypothetical protein